MVHAKVKIATAISINWSSKFRSGSHDEILLVKRLSVEPFAEVSHGIVGVECIVWISAMLLRVVPLYCVQVIGGPIDRLAKIGRVLDG